MNIKSILILVFVATSLPTTSLIAQYKQYADSTTHSRGITGFKNSLYLSSNTGLVYEYNVKTHKSKCLNPAHPLQELRDIHVNREKIIAMQSHDASQLCSILNGTQTILSIDEKDVFFDGMAMYALKGMLFGDPVNGKFPIYYTNSGGIKWSPTKTTVSALEGEFGYSASGTSIIYIDGSFIIVTGGLNSRFISTSDMGKTWSSSKLPFEANASSGAFSVAMNDLNNGVVVGGNYKNPEDSTRNCFITNDGGKTWRPSKKGPNGYRSCVIVHKGVYYACGTSGIDYSLDQGMNWSALTTGKFYSLAVLKNKLYASASEGRIAKFKLVK